MKTRNQTCFVCLILLIMMFFNSCQSINDNTDITTDAPGNTSVDNTDTDTPIESTTTIDVSLLEPNNLLRYSDKVRAGDWAPALTAALITNDEVYIPAGVYNMSRVSLISGKRIFGDGDATQIVALGSKLFQMEGSTSTEIKLSEDIPDFSDTVKLTAAIGAKAGDIIYLLGQRNCTILDDCGYDWVLGRSFKSGTACFYAEFLEVESVSDDGLTLKSASPTVFPFYYADGTRESVPREPEKPAPDYPYMRDGTTVRLVSPVENVTVRDLKITNCNGPVFSGSWMRNCVIENVNMYSDDSMVPDDKFAFLTLSEALDCTVRKCSFYVTKKPVVSLHNTSDDYGSYNTARMTSSYRSGFDGCISNFASHSFLIGKSHKNGTSYGCYVKNCIASGSIWSGVYVAGGCYNTTITGNTVTSSGQGITVAGKKNIISGNTIKLSLSTLTDYYYVRKKHGGTAGIAMIEGCSTDTVVENNTISECSTAVLIRDGYEETNIFEAGQITIRGNTVNDCVRAVMLFRHEKNVGKKNLELIITDNTFNGGAAGTGYAGICAFLFDPELSGQVIENNTITGFPKEIIRAGNA